MLPNQHENKEAILFYNKAIQASNNNDFEEAKKLYQQAINLYPEYFSAHCNLGTIYFSQDNFKQALICFNKALELKPTDFPSLYNMASLFSSLGYLEKSEFYLTLINKYFPLDINIYTKLGKILRLRNKYDEYIDLAIKQTTVFPDNGLGYYQRGLAYVLKEQYQLAKTYFDKAVQLTPELIKDTSPEGCVSSRVDIIKNPEGKKFLLCLSDRIETELKYLQIAIELFPDDFEPNFNIARKYADEEKFILALKHFEKAFKHNPDNTELLSELANCYYQLNKLSDAIKTNIKLIFLEPGTIMAYKQLATIYESQDNLQQAIDVLKKALEQNMDEENLSTIKEWLNTLISKTTPQVTSETQPVMNEVQEEITADKVIESSQHYLSLGIKCAMSGDMDSAINHFNRALSIEPDNPSIYYNIANAMAQKQDFNNAINYYNKAIQLKPDYLKAYQNLGITFQKIGKTENAQQCFKKVEDLKAKTT